MNDTFLGKFKVSKMWNVRKSTINTRYIEEFDISNNLFTSLTNLPTALKEFSGKQNKLLTLPSIPATTRIVTSRKST